MAGSRARARRRAPHRQRRHRRQPRQREAAARDAPPVLPDGGGRVRPPPGRPVRSRVHRRADTLFYDLDEMRPYLQEALAFSKRPDVHIWMNRFPPQHLEGYEHLIQDPYKLNDEVRGRKEEYARLLDEGDWLDCREPARCKYCYLERLCDTLEGVIETVDASKLRRRARRHRVGGDAARRSSAATRRAPSAPKEARTRAAHGNGKRVLAARGADPEARTVVARGARRRGRKADDPPCRAHRTSPTRAPVVARFPQLSRSRAGARATTPASPTPSLQGAPSTGTRSSGSPRGPRRRRPRRSWRSRLPSRSPSFSHASTRRRGSSASPPSRRASRWCSRATSA